MPETLILYHQEEGVRIEVWWDCECCYSSSLGEWWRSLMFAVVNEISVKSVALSLVVLSCHFGKYSIFHEIPKAPLQMMERT